MAAEKGHICSQLSTWQTTKLCCGAAVLMLMIPPPPNTHMPSMQQLAEEMEALAGQAGGEVVRGTVGMEAAGEVLVQEVSVSGGPAGVGWGALPQLWRVCWLDAGLRLLFLPSVTAAHQCLHPLHTHTCTSHTPNAGA